MVACGSGMAPLLSMLTELTQKKDRRPVTVIFGARTCEELYHIDRLKALCDLSVQAEFVPVVEEAWRGLERGNRPRNRCHRTPYGQPQRIRRVPLPVGLLMVEAVHELVVRLGVREANVYFDAFVPTGVVEPSLTTG